MKIQISDLSFTYPASKQQAAKEVLKGVSFSFDDTQPTVLLAPSGAGKTTLLRILAGFLKPDSGQVEGLDPKEKLSIVFQEDRLFDTMNIFQNWKIAVPGLTREKAAELMEGLGLDPKVLDERPATLSGGMRRRAAVGRALLYDAPVLLMDEPFQGLDDETRLKVIDTVRRYAEGKALLIITHDPEDAERLGARTVRMIEKGMDVW